MNWLMKLLGIPPARGSFPNPSISSSRSATREVTQAELDRAYADLRRTMANETPEEKTAFYQEVSRLLKKERDQH